MSRDFAAERRARERRIEKLKNRYLAEMRAERGQRPGRRWRRFGSTLAVVAVVIGVLVVPRLLADGLDEVKERALEAVEKRSDDLVADVEERLDVEIDRSPRTISIDEVGATGGGAVDGWALPLDVIDARRAVRPHHSYPAWDYGTAVGTPVYAMRAARVASATDDDAARCGGTVRLMTDDDVELTYCHLSAVLVESGERVEAGQLLGRTGGEPGAPGAGRSSGPHLHLQIRHQGRLLCPQAQLVALAEGQALAVRDLPDDCFYTSSGLAGLGDAGDRDEPWFVWD